MMRTASIVTSLLALGFAAQVGVAQDGASDDAVARRIYRAGRQAFADGDYETAHIRFREAYELSHRGELLYNIAQALDRLRRDEETLQALRSYLEEVPDTSSRAEVEARIAVLTRMVERRQRLEEERRQREAEIARTERRSRPRVGRQPEARVSREPEDRPTSPPERPPLHPAFALATGGVALVAGGLAIWTGLETLSLNDAYNRAAPSEYEARARLYDEGTTYQTVTNVLFLSATLIGGAAVAMLFFTDWADVEGERARAGWRPYLSVAPNGLVAGPRGWF